MSVVQQTQVAGRILMLLQLLGIPHCLQLILGVSVIMRGKKKELLYCKILLKKEGNFISRKPQITPFLVIFYTKPNGKAKETEGERLLLIASFILLAQWCCCVGSH